MDCQHSTSFVSTSDRVRYTLLATICLNLDVLQLTDDFYNIQTLIKHYKHTSQDTLHIQDLGRDPIYGCGIYVTKSKYLGTKHHFPYQMMMSSITTLLIK